MIQSSAWDRIAQFEISLQKLRHDEVRRLVSVRLERVVAPFAEVEAVRQEQQRDNLFPLGRVWAERFFARRVDWRPRDAINGACDAWQIMQKNLLSRGGIPSLDDWHVLPSANGELPPAEFTEEQSRDAIDRMVTKKVADCCEETRRTSGSLPPDADNLAGLIDVLLQQVGGVEIERPTANKAERGFPYNLIVRQLTDGSEVRTGVRCLATDSAISTTSSLRWIIQDDKPPDRVLLVTDERRPLAFGAKPNAQGRLFFDELRQRGHGKLQHVELTFDDYALLDAVVSTARSNDLEIELPAGKTRSVSAAEIIAAHRRAGRYASLPVLRDLFAAPVRSLTPGSA